MASSILRKIALWLLGFVAAKLDPDFQQDLDAYQANRATQEALIRQAQSDNQQLESQLDVLASNKDALQKQIAQSQQNVNTLNKEIGDLDERRDSTSSTAVNDHDIVRADL